MRRLGRQVEGGEGEATASPLGKVRVINGNARPCLGSPPLSTAAPQGSREWREGAARDAARSRVARSATTPLIERWSRARYCSTYSGDANSIDTLGCRRQSWTEGTVEAAALAAHAVKPATAGGWTAGCPHRPASPLPELRGLNEDHSRLTPMGVVVVAAALPVAGRVAPTSRGPPRDRGRTVVWSRRAGRLWNVRLRDEERPSPATHWLFSAPQAALRGRIGKSGARGQACPALVNRRLVIRAHEGARGLAPKSFFSNGSRDHSPRSKRGRPLEQSVRNLN